jgi:hypothetical protein
MTIYAKKVGIARTLRIDVDPDHIRSCGKCFIVDIGAAEKDACRVVCGDPQDIPESGGFLGNGIVVEFNGDQSMDIFSSITGMPVLYCYTVGRHTVFATNLEFLSDQSNSTLELDWDMVKRLAISGRLAPGRTLFTSVKTVAPGTRIHVSSDGNMSEAGRFVPPELCFDSPIDYLRAQRDAFRAAMARMDLRSSFLSLTAGLDTRSVLAVILEQGHRIDTITIGGVNPSIDVRRASALAQAFGLHHRIVSLGSAYRDALPSLCESASLVTGGVCSFSETPDLWLYEQLDGCYGARLSGNLGNQMGRCDSEGVGTRGARLDVLGRNGAVREALEVNTHWMLDAAEDECIGSPRFLIQVESPCSSAANYVLGSSCCLQQTPYADQKLISLKLREPVSGNRKSLSAMRLKNLRHQFIGEPVESSFQRQLICEVGGYVSECPVNWGWRPRGGFDPSAVLLGFGAFTDTVLGMLGKRIPILDRARSAIGVAELAEFERRAHFYHGAMPEFIRDTVLCRHVRESGVFAMDCVEPLITRGFYDRRNFATIEFVLDLALVVRNFL